MVKTFDMAIIKTHKNIADLKSMSANSAEELQSYVGKASDTRDVLQAYRMFANDKGWRARLEAGIESGLAAEVAVEKEQSATRARMARVQDAYLRERLHDLDDLSNRLLRVLTGQDAAGELPDNAILVARNIGPGELMDYGRRIKGVVLEEGSVGSHATIVARALAIPLIIQADRITVEAVAGDQILVDGDAGIAHLRPDEAVRTAFHEKAAMMQEAQQAYAALRDEPATTQDGITIALLVAFPAIVLWLPSLAQ